MKTTEKIKILIKIALNGKHLKRVSTKEPIFIGGCGRSGTTILLSILGAHKKIQAIPYESSIFLLKNLEVNSKIKTKVLLYNLLIKHKKKSAHRWLEKTPRNIHSIKEIKNIFDNKFKFIHIVRDGRDVITSKHPTKNKNEYWIDTDRWVKDVQEGLKYKNDKNVLTIKYEDLVSSRSDVIMSILNFIDEEYTDEIDNYTNYTNVKKNSAWNKEVQKIYNTSVKKWEEPEHRYVIEDFYNNEKAMNLMLSLRYIEFNKGTKIK